MCVDTSPVRTTWVPGVALWPSTYKAPPPGKPAPMGPHAMHTLVWLRETGSHKAACEIRTALGMTPGQVHSALHTLLRQGSVKRFMHKPGGVYRYGTSIEFTNTNP